MQGELYQCGKAALSCGLRGHSLVDMRHLDLRSTHRSSQPSPIFVNASQNHGDGCVHVDNDVEESTTHLKPPLRRAIPIAASPPLVASSLPSARMPSVVPIQTPFNKTFRRQNSSEKSTSQRSSYGTFGRGTMSPRAGSESRFALIGRRAHDWRRRRTGCSGTRI